MELDWNVVTYPDFAAEAKSRLPGLLQDQLLGMWAQRLDIGWYATWETRQGLKDEQDLYDRVKQLIAIKRVDPLHPDAALHPDLRGGLMLIDEAQSMTPLVIKILALSSGRLYKFIVGLDSKLSLCMVSAGR